MSSKYSLSSGSICLESGCKKCCKETEMPLTVVDIDRIVSLGFSRDDFSRDDGEGGKILRNSGQFCFFMLNNKCSIYEQRPEGCRLYPLVYDPTYWRLDLDEICPERENFKITKKDENKFKALLRRIEEEKRSRV